MNAETWLEQVRKLDELIDAKLSERDKLWALATRMVPNMDGMPHAKGGVSDPVGSNVVKIIALAEEADKLIDRFVDHKEKVIKALETLPEKEYAVLHKHYIRYMTYEKIAEDMKYSDVRQVYRIRRKALQNLEKVIECHV